MRLVLSHHQVQNFYPSQWEFSLSFSSSFNFLLSLSLSCMYFHTIQDRKRLRSLWFPSLLCFQQLSDSRDECYRRTKDVILWYGPKEKGRKGCPLYLATISFHFLLFLLKRKSALVWLDQLRLGTNCAITFMHGLLLPFSFPVYSLISALNSVTAHSIITNLQRRNTNTS